MKHAEMYISFRRVPSVKLQKPLLGVEGTDRHEHHNCTCLLSCLRKTKRKPNPIKKKYSMPQDIAGAQQEQAQPQRLTTSQAAAQSADTRQQPAALANACRGTGPAACTPCTPIFGVNRCGAHSPVQWWRGIAARLRWHGRGQARP